MPATKFGAEYLTYVMWAITPEGRATNLGEVLLNGSESKLNVTTELQAFGLIVTAEPYFAVTQPSDVVVMENFVRDDTRGAVEIVQAKYELLQRGTYLMTSDPSTICQAGGSIEGRPLELLRGAKRRPLRARRGRGRVRRRDLQQGAGTARTRRGQSPQGPGTPTRMIGVAREAAQAAEDARLIALQRREAELDRTRRAARARPRGRGAGRRSGSHASRRRPGTPAAAGRGRARTRGRRAPHGRGSPARGGARRQRSRQRDGAPNARPSKPSGRLPRVHAPRPRQPPSVSRQSVRLPSARAEQLARERAEAEARAQQAAQTAAQAERERAELREKLQQQLNVILETRESARGLIVNMSDVLFDTASANLKPGAREKLARVAGILLAYPGLEVADRRPHRQRRQRRLQSAAVRAASGIGARLSGLAGRPSATRSSRWASANRGRSSPTRLPRDGSRTAASSWSSRGSQSQRRQSAESTEAAFSDQRSAISDYADFQPKAVG